MPLNFTDAEDIYLEAHDNVEQFMAEFDREFYAPIRKLLVGAMMGSLPPEVMAQLQAMSPQAMDVLQRRYGGRNAQKPNR